MDPKFSSQSLPSHTDIISCCAVLVLALHTLVTAAQDQTDPDFWTLRRLELVPVTGDTGAELNIYNVPEEEVNAKNNIVCKIFLWAHHQYSVPTTETFESFYLRKHLPPAKWYAQDLKPNVTLQTKITYEIQDYRSEGTIKCNIISPQLHSNTMLLRFKDAVTVLFTFSKASIVEVRTSIDEYKIGTPKENITYAIIDHMGKNVTLARVSFHGLIDEFRGKDMGWSDRITKLRDHFRMKKLHGVLRSTRFCHPERDDDILWPKTPVGGRGLPVTPCAVEDGSLGPVRHCVGSFFQGVQWEAEASSVELQAHCPPPSQRLAELVKLGQQMEEMDSFNKLEKEVGKETNLSPIEISLVARAMSNAAEHIKNMRKADRPTIASVLKIPNKVLNSNQMYINSSDTASGSSAALRSATEKMMEAAANLDTKPVSLEHVSGFSALPGANVRGFRVSLDGYPGNTENGKATMKMKLIFWNESKDMQDDSVAFMLLQKPTDDTGITAILYNQGSLYPVDPAHNSPGFIQTGPVVAITTFKEEGTKTTSPLTILLLFSKGRFLYAEKWKCVFWKEIYKTWTDDGCKPVNDSQLVPSDMFGCVCLHLTDFSLLVVEPSLKLVSYDPSVSVVTNDRKLAMVNEDPDVSVVIDDPDVSVVIDDPIVSMVNVVCSSVSLLCLLAIFLYVALCPKWCDGPYIKINLNLSASLALSLTIGLVEEVRRRTCPTCGFSVTCVALGGAQHYLLLTSFCWVVVLAVFLASRVDPNRVLQTRMTHLLLRASIIGWGLPVIPVAVILGIGTQLYSLRPGTAFCFPSGDAFYLGVLAPSVAAMLISIAAFLLIARTLFCYSSPVQGSSAKHPELLRRSFTAFLLLSLLGINWVMALPIHGLKSNPTAFRAYRLFVASTVLMQGPSQFVLLLASKKSNWTRLSERLSEMSSRVRDSLQLGKTRSQDHTRQKESDGKFIVHLSGGTNVASDSTYS